VKVAYPSTGADLKGLLKSAWYDPNPVVIFEHKGLYWSKNPGTERAKTVEPDAEYRLPFGKANRVQTADAGLCAAGKALTVVAYGMGVHWALNASAGIEDRVEVLDLRTLVPLDERAVLESVQKTGRCLVLTEEPASHSFAQALAGRIGEKAFGFLDAPVRTLGSEDVPAIPLNATLEARYLPDATKVRAAIEDLLAF
jgi:2-oxoisovalerate dehydrogenase E1 component